MHVLLFLWGRRSKEKAYPVSDSCDGDFALEIPLLGMDGCFLAFCNAMRRERGWHGMGWFAALTLKTCQARSRSCRETSWSTDGNEYEVSLRIRYVPMHTPLQVRRYRRYFGTFHFYFHSVSGHCL